MYTPSQPPSSGKTKILHIIITAAFSLLFVMGIHWLDDNGHQAVATIIFGMAAIVAIADIARTFFFHPESPNYPRGRRVRLFCIITLLFLGIFLFRLYHTGLLG